MRTPAGPDLHGLTARRICVIKPSALGDVIQTLPILGPLRARFPEATVSWVINKGLAGLIDGHPGIDELIPFNRGGRLREWGQLLRRLRGGRFDLVLDLQGLLRTGVMTWATGAAVRVGLQTAREGSARACTHIVDGTSRGVPARSRAWRALEALGAPTDLAPSTAVPLQPADRAWAAGKLKALPGPRLAVCPGARWETKRWPATKFADLALKAHEEFGAAVVVLGSPDERHLCIDVEERLRRSMPEAFVMNLGGGTTLRQLAAIIEACTWAVTNDSGPLHLADAVGTPAVGLFTCTSPWLSGPAPERHELLSTRATCAAGYHKTCPLKGAMKHHCHAELEVDRAVLALRRLARRSRRATEAA